MKKNTANTVLSLLAWGLLLALFKVVYLFFDFYNIMDVIVFAIAGFLFSGGIASSRRILALSLALPAFILCLLFALSVGYSSIMKGVGTSFAVSLIVIPLATYTGAFVRLKRDE